MAVISSKYEESDVGNLYASSEAALPGFWSLRSKTWTLETLPLCVNALNAICLKLRTHCVTSKAGNKNQKVFKKVVNNGNFFADGQVGGGLHFAS